MKNINVEANKLFSLGFDEGTIEALLDNEITLNDIPDFLSKIEGDEVADFRNFDVIMEVIRLIEDHTYIDVKNYYEAGYLLEDIENLLNEGVLWEDVPEFLEDSKDYSEIVEWLEVIEEYDVDVANAAHSLDIEPENVGEAYAGCFSDDGDFAENLVTECYDLSSSNLPEFITFHIDWDGVAQDIMGDYSESNGYYFRRF